MKAAGYLCLSRYVYTSGSNGYGWMPYVAKGQMLTFRSAQTMDQFRSFKKFVNKIDKYGMKAGIVKVVPPQEWYEQLESSTTGSA